MSKRRPKDIGTAAETAVVRYLQAHGFPGAERRALRGELDAGDITGTPGICWEVKARNREYYDEQVAAWLVETETERVNARADYGVLVLRRSGYGPARAGSWWAVMRLDGLLGPHRVGIWTTPGSPVVGGAPVRMLLGDAVRLLHLAGYGTPPGTP